jgi:hypothetical protein
VENLSIEREDSGDGPRGVVPRLRQPRHPESRAEHDACGGSRRCHELAPRQQGAFPKMGVTNILVAMWRFPKCREIYVSDTQQTLLSRHFCRIYHQRSTTLWPELVENAPALVRVIKQNQAFNQRGDSSFTFHLCSLEPCAEDACSLLAPAGPSPEQARYQRRPGNAGFETSYEEQQKKLPNVRLGSITEILLQNLSRRIKYSESLVVCQLLIQLKPLLLHCRLSKIGSTFCGSFLFPYIVSSAIRTASS